MFPLHDTRKTDLFPLFTYALIALNVFVFFLELTSANTEAFIDSFALIPANVNFSDVNTLKPFITSQFLHAGFLHILSNMWFLSIFGDNVEERLGKLFYPIIYLGSGIVGGLIQYFFAPDSTIPMLGASGAVAGVLGAYLVFFPDHQVETLIPLGFTFTTARISASFMLIYWFIIQLFSGVGSIASAQTGGVAFWAHVGGFATGWFLARLYPFKDDDEFEEGELLDF